MNSFELNKILGALLGVVFVIFSVSILSDAIFHAPAPETPGYAIAVADDGADGGDASEEAGPEPIGPLLASADASKGEAIFKRCQACHTMEDGGANKVGPNLWEIVDRPIAGHEGFSYSAAMKEFSEGGSKLWTYDNLDHFLTSPKGFVSGTAMAFAGLKKIEDRANLIAFLREHAATPVALPAAEAAAPAEEAPAEGAPAEGAPADAAPAETAPAGEAPAGEAPATEGATSGG
ncbi:c-type cytochrome [Nitratireductor pacificus]|uniref:Cytochrome c, class I n=1 Tax=Nitratireductor pacificus pht-3B TaxID=391937 RepID=K2MBF4_9HYPH|nr:cytochrome c family protein [Nitratireductor pacificus]EKF19486.1 cytochrome c, class I [Nitratireductor pacificus pht-3B]